MQPTHLQAPAGSVVTAEIVCRIPDSPSVDIFVYEPGGDVVRYSPRRLRHSRSPSGITMPVHRMRPDGTLFVRYTAAQLGVGMSLHVVPPCDARVRNILDSPQGGPVAGRTVKVLRQEMDEIMHYDNGVFMNVLSVSTAIVLLMNVSSVEQVQTHVYIQASDQQNNAHTQALPLVR